MFVDNVDNMEIRARKRGRKPIDQFWIDWIRSKTVNEPGLSLRRMAEQALEEAKRLGRDDPPSERTIRRYREEIQAAPDSVQREYHYVYWPESFERGDLPWESAQYVLELMRLQAGGLRPQDHRPDVREARWYWYLSQTVPNWHPAIRAFYAHKLAKSYPKGTQMVYLRDGQARHAPIDIALRREVENLILYCPDNPPGLGKNRDIPDWDQGIGRLISREKKEKKGDLTHDEEARKQ